MRLRAPAATTEPATSVTGSAATEQSVQFHGSLKLAIENGTSIGSSPSTLEFAASSGSLQSTLGAPRGQRLDADANLYGV
jgi:hypothetical protein